MVRVRDLFPATRMLGLCSVSGRPWLHGWRTLCVTWQVLEKHKVDATTGLPSDEVLARERIHGPNEMDEGDQVRVLLRREAGRAW